MLVHIFLAALVVNKYLVHMATMNTKAEGAAMDKIHVFERAGLGKAPFRFVRQYKAVFQACQGAPIQPGTSCDYCGTGIMYVFVLRGADGREFKVGSDCICKAGDAGLRRVIDPIVKKHQAEQRHAREAAKLEEGRAFLVREDVQAALRSKPHPQARRAEKGETLADMVAWYMQNAGTKGRLDAIKIARKAVEVR